jgi:hypothetical protein
VVVALNTAGSATSASYTLPNTHRPASDLYTFLPWRLGLPTQTNSPANSVGGTQ